MFMWAVIFLWNCIAKMNYYSCVRYLGSSWSVGLLRVCVKCLCSVIAATSRRWGGNGQTDTYWEEKINSYCVKSVVIWMCHLIFPKSSAHRRLYMRRKVYDYTGIQYLSISLNIYVRNQPQSCPVRRFLPTSNYLELYQSLLIRLH